MANFVDRAFPVLHGEPTINDSQRSDLWDLFHQSANANELDQHLAGLNLHPDLKKQLIHAKSLGSVEYDNLDRAVQAIHRMTAMDRTTLDVAEGHPTVLKLWMNQNQDGE
jgi:hypothetical protein